MMATRVSDSELAARIRQQNRTNSQRRRVKLAASGQVQLLTWIPETLRRELDRVAAARGERLSETTAALLTAALKTTTPATIRGKPTAEELTPDLFYPEPPATTTDRDALMKWIGELLNEGLSGADIARRLNDSGKRTASGAEFLGGNVLRDYRTWRKKTDSTDNQPDIVA